MMRQIVSFVRRETVFCASAVLALASMAVIPPDRGYLAYRTIVRCPCCSV